MQQLYTLPTESFLHVADVYGAGDYNTDVYSAASTSESSAGGTSGGGSLVNTGVFVLGFVTIAVLIMLVAIVVKVWRRPAKQQ